MGTEKYKESQSLEEMGEMETANTAEESSTDNQQIPETNVPSQPTPEGC